jgi:translation initiation factor 1 (eIF-1/SUI1)
MVQGDQRKAVSQLLSEKGVPEKWIKLDGIKKKK